MPPIYGILIFTGCVIAVWLLRSSVELFFSEMGRFWRLTGKHPEHALLLLSEEPDVLIDPKEKVPKTHMGPFWIRDRGGGKWKIYMNHESADDVQARVTKKLLGYYDL